MGVNASHRCIILLVAKISSDYLLYILQLMSVVKYKNQYNYSKETHEEGTNNI